MSKITKEMLNTVPQERLSVFMGLHHEREKQDAKFGEQDHSPADWLAILGEELGESGQALGIAQLFQKLTEKYGDGAKAHLEAKFGSKTPASFQKAMEHFRTEIEQTTAVGVSILEHWDRTYKI